MLSSPFEWVSNPLTTGWTDHVPSDWCGFALSLRREGGTHCLFFFFFLNSSVFSLQSLWVWGLWACCVVVWIDLNFHKLFIIVIIIIVRVCVCHRVRMEARGQILGNSLSCFSHTKHSMTRAPVSFQVIPYLHRSSCRRSAGLTDVHQCWLYRCAPASPSGFLF